MSTVAVGAHDAGREGILRDIASKIPVRPSTRRRQLWIACMVVGFGSFLLLLFAFHRPERAWGAFTINTLYWLGIAQAGMVLVSAIRLSNGRWGGPMVRIAESLSAYLPYGYATMMVLLFAGIWTYLPWTKHVLPRQAPFLNVPFLYIRTLGGLGLLWWLTRRSVRLSLRHDAHLLRDYVGPELKPEYDKLAGDWKGDEAERLRTRHVQAHLAPQITLLFAVVFTVLAWDFILALTPMWVSSLFGWWFFIGCFITGLAMTGFVAARARAHYRLEDYVTPHHFWDLGKILFSFCIFWVYQFWAQYLVIWYGNLPDETGWVFLRLEQPWRTWAFAAFIMIFAIPFLGMLNKTTKANPLWFSAFALLILAGVWVERHVLVMPSLDPIHVWIGLPEIGVTVGFLGMFGWAVQGFLAKYPAIVVADALENGGGHGH
jgi:hypothetical protein